MEKYSQLYEARYSRIKPGGWLREILLAEKNGMPGNLDKIGYPFDTRCWEFKSLADGGWEQWWPYEQTAYWLDGLVRTACLLDDKELLDKAKKQIDKALSYDDTFIGPVEIKAHNRCYRWSIAVFARAVYALWSFTGEENYLKKLLEHYLNDSSDYSGYRDIVNVETMLKLYEHFDNEEIYQKAKKAYEKFDKNEEEEASNATQMLTEKPPFQHGVTYNEQAKLAAIMFSYTGGKRYLDAAINGYAKIDKFDMLPDGVHTSCEFTYGNETKWAHESCDISDYTWSIGYLLEATGLSEYADKIERAIFNAFFGAIGPDFRTIQYLSSVNQVIAARNSTHIDEFANSPKMAFQPHHYPECCVGNISRAFPNYVLRMYQTTTDGECISLYGDSEYNGENIKISQSGNYPFGDKIILDIGVKNADKNNLMFRIPAWCKDYIILKNGVETNAQISSGYAKIKVADGDRIELEFKKDFSSKKSVDGGVYFEYGPFLLALKIDEKWEVDTLEKRQTPDFPAYNVYAKTPWNYCVTGAEDFEIIKKEIADNPFMEGFPFEIKIKARKLLGFETVRREMLEPDLDFEMGLDEKQVECGATQIFEDQELTPELPSSEFIESNLGEEETITLVPYGCTNLRVTVFPQYTKKG